MRDLVLAEQFDNANIIFATQELSGNINHKIQEKDYTIEILNSNDIEELIDIIKKYSIDMIIIDHYGIDSNYEKALKEVTNITIFVLDDTYEKHHCDILLNHNIYADSLSYKNLVPEHCELRCGVNFTLLREEFRSEKTKQKQSSQEKKNIFIAMGGADHSNLNIKILKVLEDFPNIYANVVTTTANQYLDQLKVYAKSKENITLHINSNEIAKLMNNADFAIVTPSVTLNEVFYMEVPFIAIKTADNQNFMLDYLLKNTYPALEQFNKKNFKKMLEKLINNKDIELVNFIDLSYDEKIMVLEWRNHPNIRKWMFTQDPIALDNHLNYIDSLSLKKDREYFLVKQHNQAVGVIDFTNIDKKSLTVEFGLYAKPNLKGIGSLLMQEIVDYAFNTLKMQTLISEVFEENSLAIKLYKKFNFRSIIKKENIIVMELKNENR